MRKLVINLKQKITIHHLGPIDDCSFEIDNFTVFTGPQSNGKSTVAKAIYFFRTVKQDILNLIQQGGPVIVSGNPKATWSYTIQQRLRSKFLELFGTSWIMPQDMSMQFEYSDLVSLRVYLRESFDDADKNFICFDFCAKLEDYFNDLDSCNFVNATIGQLQAAEKKLNKLFGDELETVFIPAGRNLITLLTSQLNYIFTSLEGSQLRSLDYITKRYTELILKLKPLFSDGYQGMIDLLENEPELMKKYNSNKTAIKMLMEKSNSVLRGWYRYVDGEERLYIDSSNNKYVKINFSSSGQQEIVWVFNLLFYYLLEDKKVFLIIEEPESHLFPDSQQSIGELLALFFNKGNQVLVTTHSPYILGTFNYLLLASQANPNNSTKLRNLVDKKLWLSPAVTSSYFIANGKMESAINRDDQLQLISNELIDGASESINSITDKIFDIEYNVES